MDHAKRTTYLELVVDVGDGVVAQGIVEASKEPSDGRFVAETNTNRDCCICSEGRGSETQSQMKRNRHCVDAWEECLKVGQELTAVDRRTAVKNKGDVRGLKERGKRTKVGLK